MKKKTIIKVCGNDIEVKGHLVRIARLDGEKFTFPADPEELRRGLRKCGTRIDLLTFLQKLPEHSPKYSYPMEWDNLAVLTLSTFDQWWTQQIDNKTRNMIRKAEKKGVTLREVTFDDVLLQGICEIYNESPIRQGMRFTHYGITLDETRRYAETFPDRSIFIGAFLGQSMVGFMKLVTDEAQTQACVIHILSMLRHRDKAPTNALIAQAVRSCAERGIPYLVYDRFSYGKKQGDSLSTFKQQNDFKKVDVPRYYVPLTPLGWAAIRLGLHHEKRFVDCLPGSVTARLRELRSAWYSRKLRVSADAS
jgi:hypothetical protein